MDNLKYSKKYIGNRENVLKYTNKDMNLELEKDDQIYIAVFDIPSESIIVGNETKTLALIFGLNTHLYMGNGESIVNLEKNENVMKAMQSLFISAPQVLGTMSKIDDTSFYESKNVRAYLKTRTGIHFKELTGRSREEKFLEMLLNNVLTEISNCI